MYDVTFEEELNRQPVDVLRASLGFARGIAYPDLEAELYLEQVDKLAAQARNWIQQGSSQRHWIASRLSTCQRAELLSDFLFTHQGFKGNSQAFNDPRNSYLNEVLERRLGIPISLSVLYISLAERLEIPAQGIGLPGHFIVQAGEDCYLDPYHGGERLSKDDCSRLVSMATGYSGPFNQEWLLPLTPQATLTRMLNNLRNSYLELEDWPHALRAIEHLRMLHPDLPDFLRDLGGIYYRQGALSMAVDHFSRYLSQAPKANDAERVEKWMQAAVKKLAEKN